MTLILTSVSDTPTMDESVLALATAGLAEAIRWLEASCRAGVRSKLAVSLPQGCSAAAAVHGFVQCRSALQSAHRAEMDVGDTSPLVIPMPTSSRLVGAFGVTLRARDARAAVDAAFAPTAQASTPSSRCRTHLAAAGCGHASAVYGWARTTRTSRPPAEPPPRAVTCVRSSARS